MAFATESTKANEKLKKLETNNRKYSQTKTKKQTTSNIQIYIPVL